MYDSTGNFCPDMYVDQLDPIRYVARRALAETFGHMLYALAWPCGVERVRQIVVLGDGAVWIWGVVAEHLPHAVQIVAIWHAHEHVWKVAHVAFERGSP